MSSHRVKAALLAGALCVLAAGCGGDGDGKSAASPSSASAPNVELDVSTGDLLKGKAATLQVTTRNFGRSVKGASLTLAFRTAGLELPSEGALKVEYRDGEKRPWKRLALTAGSGALHGTLSVDVPSGTVERWWRLTPAFGPSGLGQKVEVSGSLSKAGEKVGDSTWEQALRPVTVLRGGRSTPPGLSPSAWSEYTFEVRNLLPGALDGVQVEAGLSCSGGTSDSAAPCDGEEDEPGFAAQYFDGDGWKPLDRRGRTNGEPKANLLLRAATTVPAKGGKQYRFRLRPTPSLPKPFDRAALELRILGPGAKDRQDSLLGNAAMTIPLDAG